MTNAPLREAGRSSNVRTGKDLTETIPAATDEVPHRCTLSPLCRCHFDCRPELVEAVSAA